MKKYLFLSIKKVIEFHQLMNWLDHIKSTDTHINIITKTEDDNDWDIEKTNQLHELQILNQRREELIKKLTNNLI
jgi:hypothetical protein